VQRQIGRETDDAIYEIITVETDSTIAIPGGKACVWE